VFGGFMIITGDKTKSQQSTLSHDIQITFLLDRNYFVCVGFNMMKIIAVTVLIFLFTSCVNKDKAGEIVSKSVSAHGMDGLKNQNVSFSFRSKDYAVSRFENGYVYSRSFIQDTAFYQDYLINSVDFVRVIDGDTSEVSVDWQGRYGSSINSVLYFFLIPYVLQDDAVIKTFVGKEKIEDQMYLKLKVVFDEENGGKDHDDEFLYWINQATHLVDFFAYSYQTDEGGVRFRQAINRDEIDGIIFQDYINYRAEAGTPLSALTKLFASGDLEKLSTIDIQDIIISKPD
jgi:hypothetical protein